MLDVEQKLRTIVIKFKDSLESNTTYTLNFGNAIKDVNEGNIARNFTYIFSTGSAFDSLTLSGKVLLAESGKTDSTLIVMLHRSSEDSALIKEKPRYVTRLDSAGNFTFHNLPSDTFYLYALKMEGSYNYFSPEKQLFAFADTPVIIQTLTKPDTLYAYAEKPSAPRAIPQIAVRQRASANDKRLKLQTNLTAGLLDLLSNLIINFEQPLRALDTSLIHLSTDTTYTPVANYHILTDSTRKQLTVQHTWKENTRYSLILEKDFAEDTLGRKLLRTDTISFNTKKLSDYGSLRIRFRNVDLSTNPVVLFIQNDNVVKSIPLHSSEINEAVFLPGDYELKILTDRNKNGKWDPGEFFGKHIQPEIVRRVTSRPSITVKANWDNDFDITL
jgi:hypothetical protein